MNTLVLGVGTGRCGTKSLTRLLEYQSGVKVTHERYGPKVRWNCPSNLWPYRLWENSKLQDCDYIGDIAFYWTPQIDWFLDRADKEGRDIRIIGLKRDRQETVESYDKWKPNSDHWSFHGYRTTQPDPWDKCYPCYNTDNKKEGIGMFWDEVYDILQGYPDERVRCFPTQYLNTEHGVREVLSHVGFENPNIQVGLKINAPNIEEARNSSQW